MREIADEAAWLLHPFTDFFQIRKRFLIAAAVRTQTKFNVILDKFFDEKKPEESLKKVLNIYIDFISENDTYFRMMTILMSQGNLNTRIE
jgi:hypothetical protein